MAASCSYTRAIVDERLAENVFVCRWFSNGRSVRWVTQLVVHHDFRERRIASHLLTWLRQRDDEIYGIMSSHPAACLAAAGAFGGSTMNLDFVSKEAGSVMNCSPVSYVKDAHLRGSLFYEEQTDGAVSSIFTNFYVDHNEPLEALARVRSNRNWGLGGLLEGHEFLVLCAVKSPGKPRSTSSAVSESQKGETKHGMANITQA